MNLPGALLFFGIVAALVTFFVWAIRWSAKSKREYQTGRRNDELSRFFFAGREKNWYVSWQAVLGFALSAVIFLVVCAYLGVL